MNDLLHFQETENLEMDKALEVLSTNRIRCSQVIDLLRTWRKELVWIVASIARELHDPLLHLLNIFPRKGGAEILAHLDHDDHDYCNKAADIITRDILSSIPGLNEMDRFIDVLIRKLEKRLTSTDDLLYLPEAGGYPETGPRFYLLDHLQNQEAARLGPVIGNKAGNLVYLINRDISVPPGVVLPSSYRYRSEKDETGPELGQTLKGAVDSIEKASGLHFGDPARPLFLSARSGSYISMPGIMATVLYCGMNTEICRAVAAVPGNARFAWDSYRRFIEDYSATVFNLDDRILGRILTGFMKKEKIPSVDDLDAGRLEAITELYLEGLAEREYVIPLEAHIQLEESVRAVYASWSREKAVQFRKAMAISEYWGTAVLLMQMIPCNRKGSGASVFFTRNPVSLAKGVYGETRESATGDDLVGGRLISRPISHAQESKSNRSLETSDPGLFSLHIELAGRIEEAMGGLPQEVEAAYVAGPDGVRTIHALQTRRMEYQPGAVSHFEEICRMDTRLIGRGIGVHGGVLSGVAAYAGSGSELKKAKRAAGAPLILIREYSSTGDVSLMPYVDGIITAAGGATSHAAILSQKFGLVAVVGCAEMSMVNGRKSGRLARINKTLIREGDPITIDGTTGNIYSGICKDRRQSSGEGQGFRTKRRQAKHGMRGRPKK
jgi:pyruvate,orthophosphate dikinase